MRSIPRPLLVGDEETIAIGMRLANEIARYVYAPPVSEARWTIPEAVEQSRTMKTKPEPKETP